MFLLQAVHPWLLLADPQGHRLCHGPQREWTRQASASAMPPRAPALTACARTMVRLRGMQELLAYGASDDVQGAYVPFVPPVENGQASVLSAAATTVIHQAMFEDACTFLAARPPSGFNITTCRSTGSGIFTHGLMAAMQVS